MAQLAGVIAPALALDTTPGWPAFFVRRDAGIRRRWRISAGGSHFARHQRARTGLASIAAQRALNTIARAASSAGLRCVQLISVQRSQSVAVVFTDMPRRWGGTVALPNPIRVRPRPFRLHRVRGLLAFP